MNVVARLGWRTPLVIVISRLRHRDSHLRTALGARLFPHAVVAGERLGPRRLRPRACDPEPVVGDRPALRRGDRRSIRHRARAVRGGDPLCDRACADGLFAIARHAPSFGRRADRFRACRLLLQHRALGVRQARPRILALPLLRRRDRGGIVRPVPVLAPVRLPAGRLWLAERSAHLRRLDAAGPAALACSRHPARGRCVAARHCGRAAIVSRGAQRGGRAPLVHLPGARFFHLRLPARLHHRAHAGLSRRPRSLGASRRMDHRGDRPVQHHRLARLGLARQPDAEALHSRGDLPHPRACRARLHRLSR